MHSDNKESHLPIIAPRLKINNKLITTYSAIFSKSSIFNSITHLINLFEMVKIGHTIFALPFALLSVLVTANGFPKLITLVWILVAMTTARTAAMTFNRIVDMNIDKNNPRTSNRALPTGCVSVSSAIAILIVSILIFSYAAGKLGSLPLKLVPLTLLIILGYSFCKRFTILSHFVLGLALAIAPIGACIAINNALNLSVCLLSVGVLTWTAGFDIIYAIQDVTFDQKQHLYSLPSRTSIVAALWVSRSMHLMTLIAWAAFNIILRVHLFPWLAFLLIAAILIKEQWVVRKGSLENINYAFFTLNSFVGIIFFLGHIVEWTTVKIRL